MAFIVGCYQINQKMAGTPNCCREFENIIRYLITMQKISKIFRIFCHFHQFCPIKMICLVTQFDRKLQVFKNSSIWPFFGILNYFLPTLIILNDTFSKKNSNTVHSVKKLKSLEGLYVTNGRGFFKRPTSTKKVHFRFLLTLAHKSKASLQLEVWVECTMRPIRGSFFGRPTILLLWFYLLISFSPLFYKREQEKEVGSRIL